MLMRRNGLDSRPCIQWCSRTPGQLNSMSFQGATSLRKKVHVSLFIGRRLQTVWSVCLFFHCTNQKISALLCAVLMAHVWIYQVYPRLAWSVESMLQRLFWPVWEWRLKGWLGRILILLSYGVSVEKLKNVMSVQVRPRPTCFACWGAKSADSKRLRSGIASLSDSFLREIKTKSSCQVKGKQGKQLWTSWTSYQLHCMTIWQCCFLFLSHFTWSLTSHRT